MAECRSPGSCSSEARRNADDGLTRLLEISNSTIVTTLTRVLGKNSLLHLVGGSVREALLDKSQVDLDFACAFEPTKTIELLEKAGVRVIETGKRHGTITAVLEQQNVEITTFRRPGALKPDDFGKSIGEDLGGRDFTINSIAFSIFDRALIDPFHGRQDLTKKTLRAVGSAKERFAEDPLRILRMFRFGPGSGRTVEIETAEAARAAAQTLDRVSVERIHAELTRILLSEHPAEAFRLLLKLEVLKVILPEALPSVGFEQNDFHIHDVFEHTLWVIERCPSNALLRWSAFFHDLGKPRSLSFGEGGRRHFYKHEEYSTEIADTVMKRLRFSNDDHEAISNIVRHHMRPLDCGPSGVRRLIRDLGDQFENWRIFKYADAPPTLGDADVQERLNQFNKLYDAEVKRLEAAGGSKLLISGTELIEMGMRPGKELGSILKRLEEMVIEKPELNEAETLRKEAARLIAGLAGKN
jgi:tRNA nucleotidyltransferase (CCA-adding enzyme)